MVKEMGLKLSRRWIEANDLDPTHADGTDAAIRRMHDETPARQPLIYVAGDDRRSRRIGLRDGFAFGHPSADEHIELLELGRPLTLVCLHTRSSFSHAWPACCVTSDVETCSPSTAGTCRAHHAATIWRSRCHRRSF